MKVGGCVEVDGGRGVFVFVTLGKQIQLPGLEFDKRKVILFHGYIYYEILFICI